MREFMTALLECSVTMSVLVLTFIVATRWLSKRYSAKWLYYIWLVLVIGLIIPFRLHPDTAVIQMNDAPTYIQQITPGNSENIVNTAPTTNKSSQELSTISWYQIGMYLWLAGFLTFMIYHGLKHFRFLRMVNRWSEQSDTQMRDTLQKIKADMGITTPVKMQICSCISSPMMIGFIRPTILLPWSDFSVDELSYILKHELVHFKRKDLWYKSLVLLATAIHWFNPVMYLMAKVIASQCEISCDAEVVSKTDIDTRQQYSETIIGVIKNQSRMQTAFSTNFYGGKKGMKKRIFSIMDTSKKRAGALILGLALVGTLGTGAAFAVSAEGGANENVTLVGETANAETPIKWELSPEYENYGISYNDSGEMLYNGQLVRYFWDGYEIEPGLSATHYDYLNENGVVDVHTVRSIIDNGDGSVDMFGELKDIVAYSQHEFEQRDIDWLKGIGGNPTTTMIAEGGSSNTGGKTFAEIFAGYKDLGINFVEVNGRGGMGDVFYQNNPVKKFIDEKNDGGVFTYQSINGGETVVRTVYDENGKLTGIKID